MKLTSILFSAVLLFTACQNSTDPHSNEAMANENPAPDMSRTTEIEKITFQNKAHELVYEMTQKVGDYSQLRAKRDVTYSYTYTTADEKTDVVDEKYIFDGEYSYGAYRQHERTLPHLEGLIEQGFDGQTFWLKHEGKYLEDEAIMKRVTFNRKTNFYWFTMFQKLMDPGLNYEFVKEASLEGESYNIVKVSFESPDGKPTDIYQLWINKETKLIDQFLFTVADFGVIETPNLMKVEYEEVEGFLLPSKRKYTKGDWDGNNISDDWVHVSWTNIQFDTGLPKTIFTKN